MFTEQKVKTLNLERKRTSHIDFQTSKRTRKISWSKTKLTERDNKKIKEKVLKEEIRNNKKRKTHESQIKREKGDRIPIRKLNYKEEKILSVNVDV